MTQPDTSSPALYLSAPVNALVEGIYKENIPLGDVKQHGDFGLGTFNDLDGEMVMIDGRVYQIDGNGIVREQPDEVLTPFACATFYRPLSHDDFPGALDYDGFVSFVDRLLPSPNIFYAIRIDGHFSYIRTRSVPRQEGYRPLVEVTKDQPTFEWEDVEGTLAGFFTPAFMGSISVPGMHFHFLSADRSRGGHLLECRPTRGRVGVQFLPKLELSLPRTLDYLTCDFERDTEGDLHRAER